MMKIQSVQIDVLGAMAYVNDVTAVLSRKREGAADSFADIWKQSCALASLSDTELVQPRLTAAELTYLQGHLKNTTDVLYSSRLWIAS